MIQYPINVYAGRFHRVVRNRPDFFKRYDELFNAAVKNAIVAQNPDCLFANWQGVMIGSGAVWFGQTKNGDMKIKALNIVEP